jgi:hypothetical protein
MLSGVYRFPAMESVVFGKPFVEALGDCGHGLTVPWELDTVNGSPGGGVR